MKKRLLVSVVILLVQTLSISSVAAKRGPSAPSEGMAARAGTRSPGASPRQTPRPARKIVAQPAAVPSGPAPELDAPLPPRDANARIRMARWMLERGNPARAYVEATGALLRDADAAEAYFLRGCAALDLGMTAEATLDLESAVILAPDYGQAFEQLGFAFLLAGDAKKAAGAFARASELVDQEDAGSGRGEGGPVVQSGRSPRAEPGEALSKQPEEDLSGADLQATGPAGSAQQ